MDIDHSKSALKAAQTMTSRDALRLSVGTPEGQHSGIWRMWPGRAGDIYAAGWLYGGMFKYSFHRSGEWKLAFRRDYYWKNLGGEVPASLPEVVRGWRPPVYRHAVSPALRIIVPHGELVDFPVPTQKPVRWIPAPREAHAIHVLLVLTPRNKFRGYGHGEDIRPVKVWPFADGLHAWAFYLELPIEPELSEIIQAKRVELSSAGAERGPGRTASIHGQLEDESALVIELGWN